MPRWLPLPFGLALWAVSLGGADTSSLGSYGLLPALPATWYAGLFCLLAGALLALGVARPSGRLLATTAARMPRMIRRQSRPPRAPARVPTRAVV